MHNELYHHGIKGQKWGIRRYQNKDGTLTSYGRKRHEMYERDREIANEYRKISTTSKRLNKQLRNDPDVVNKKELDKIRNKTLNLSMMKQANIRDSLYLRTGERAKMQKSIANGKSSVVEHFKAYGKSAIKDVTLMTAAFYGGGIVGNILLGPVGGYVVNNILSASIGKAGASAVTGILSSAAAEYNVSAIVGGVTASTGTIMGIGIRRLGNGIRTYKAK